MRSLLILGIFAFCSWVLSRWLQIWYCYGTELQLMLKRKRERREEPYQIEITIESIMRRDGDIKQWGAERVLRKLEKTGEFDPELSDRRQGVLVYWGNLRQGEKALVISADFDQLKKHIGG